MPVENIKKRIYITVLALIGALIFAVFFIISRPQVSEPVAQQPVATTTPKRTYVSNNSTYTVLGLTHTVPWDASCNGLGHARKIDPIISIQYPQVQGLKKAETQQSINLFFEQEFLMAQLQKAKAVCGTPEDPAYYGETGLDSSFDIKLQTDTYLSLKYAETTALLSGLRPTYDYEGYTIDMTDGSVLSYKDLFKADVESRRLMKKLVLAGLPYDLKANPDADRDVLDYDFYLTQDSVVFFNIFLTPAFQSVEVKIPFNKIEDLMVARLD